MMLPSVLVNNIKYKWTNLKPPIITSEPTHDKIIQMQQKLFENTEDVTSNLGSKSNSQLFLIMYHEY